MTTVMLLDYIFIILHFLVWSVLLLMKQKFTVRQYAVLCLPHLIKLVFMNMLF